MFKKLKKGFTITELVIVIAVIAILAAVLIPTFSNVIRNANQSAAMQNCRNAITDYTQPTTGLVVSEGKNKIEDDYFFVYINSGIQQISKGTDSLTQFNLPDGAEAEKDYTIILKKGDVADVTNWPPFTFTLRQADAKVYMSDPVMINGVNYISVFVKENIEASEANENMTNYYSTAYIYTGVVFPLGSTDDVTADYSVEITEAAQA